MQNPNKPIWINKQETKPMIFVATPVHSECSIHYTQSLLTFQSACYKKQYPVSFALMKSSLVTQGRNLCVSNFLESEDPYSHFLFIDSDIEFKPETIFKMIEEDKDVIAAPYPLKALDWDKLHGRVYKKQMDADTMSKMGFTWPIKLEGKKDVSVTKGVMEVTHAPTGCMLIKKDVFKKMIQSYPNLKIEQPTIVNGEESTKPYYYNFFDTFHEPETKRYYGEDFGFCKRWTEIGGKCHIYVEDYLTHVGEYRYTGRLIDDLDLKKIDESNKSK